MIRNSLIVVLLLTAAVAAQTSSSSEKKATQPKSFDLDAIDKQVEPCQDFFEYACGAWRKNNPIPADQSRWGRFNELAEYNRSLLHQILEKASTASPDRTPAMKIAGDFYHSCMDESQVNAQGVKPLRPELDKIAAVQNKEQLAQTVAFLQSRGVAVLFRFGSSPDLHNAAMEIATLTQGGLGLPDRDYYINQDAKSQDMREKYVAHMANMFGLLGDDKATAKAEANTVLSIETKLAQASFERVKMRDPKNRDHKMKVSELDALAPNFQFAKFFTATDAPSFGEVNIAPPDFFQQVNGAVDAVPIKDWKAYLIWHSLHNLAPALSKPFVDENFDFYSRYLSGQKELEPRWKRCVRLTDDSLGEALGQPYVDQTFGKEGKDRMLELVDALEASLSTDIDQLPWMTADTKKQAAVKLKAISNKIGYPDKWRDYSSVKITRDDFAGNAERADAFESRRDLNKIGKPLDKKEWGMTPPTVNAYYSSAENDINFPAGILQPPFFDKGQDDAINFGGIGVVIGHELTHGFDDQGSKFDADGNLRSWWTPTDREEFDKRTSCVADEYGSFVPVDDLHINGRLTLGENTADNGGIRIALTALRNEQAKHPESKANQTIEGFTPEQRFFISFAQVWCENRTPESSRLLVKTDPHSPGRFRTNGTVQNSEDFAKAFGCKAGQKMVSENACRVW